MFLAMKIRKNIQSMCKKKCFEEKRVDLLLIREGGKRYYVLFKDFNTLIYNHKLHRGSKHLLLLFLRY